ncbi:MAG: AAA family ATPase [Candidatus Cloacimonadota bacterium]|nr:MAG: AAA family ATPase [Candidatus Cloacimonadota bacterium]PIE77768.1 MAG: AAA family ATPase [Candidatus Delongbacteria bacterium]
MKKLGLGIQDISKLKENNYVYVDKTELIHKLITSGSYYFLSRPRRFGKSLLVNTMEKIFKGDKELFKDTWIYDKWNFDENYPVIKINFAEIGLEELDLGKALDRVLTNIGKSYNIILEEKTYSLKFRELIEKMSKENPVAILIDEYDKPIIDYIESSKREKAEENRDILRAFYSIVKGSDKYIKLFFMTGISKFSKVSLFSELNNLTDITFNDKYINITGYTKSEIEVNYFHYLEVLEKKFKYDRETLFDKIKLWYDGYSWNGEDFVYNPYSLLSFFNNNKFNNYWFQSGTPRFLTKLIREKDVDIIKYENSFEVDSNVFDSYDIDNIDSSIILFQAGYLTIKGVTVDPEYGSETYRLAYPNKEVKDSFYSHLAGEFTGLEKTSFFEIIKKLNNNLENNLFDKFIMDIQAIYSNIPQPIFIGERESYYHTVIFIILKLMKANIIEAERMTNYGRVDAVIETKSYIYVVEFKMNSVDEALKQIKEKKYYQPYLNDGREVICVGVAFSKEERNIKEYKTVDVEELLGGLEE